MRVFELARDLNIPGKDLIDRIRALGYTVENNFNVLDEQTIKEIKEKLLEPVSRVEKAKAKASEAEEEAEAPKKRRRIISARRSKETHRIQESLGESGPLPEDQQTRDEIAADDTAEEPEVQEHSETVEAVEEIEVVASTEADEEKPEIVAEKPEEAKEVGEPAEAKEEKTEVRPAAPKEDTPHPPRPPQSPPRAVVTPPKPKERIPIEELDARSPSRHPRKPGEPEKTGWKDVKKGRPGAKGSSNDEWVRPSRRKGVRPARRGKKEAEEKHVFGPRKKAIRIGNSITVGELAGALGVKASDIIRKLMALEIMATVNASVEGATAGLLAEEYGIAVEVDTSTVEDLTIEQDINSTDLELRPPIVTIMGHVDHGKTSLLDYIRSSRVASREAGGITQHIGAYFVQGEAGDIVFLDTPGHEAFTALRARGANLTDIVVLVVAADDGIMPQTVEAIEHARAADVPIIVAINKIDREGADVGRIKTQLMEYQLLAEEFGGDTILAPVSAHTGEGVDQLLEVIHLQAEMMELKTTFKGGARGFVVESEMDRSRGPVATVIMQRGVLKVGEDFIAGTVTGRVRAMFNDQGKPVQEAGPSIPVEVLGYDELPMAGDEFVVLDSEKAARQIAAIREEKKREAEAAATRRLHLEDFLASTSGDETAVLPLVIKADTQGSLEALRATLDKQGNEQAKVEFVRAGVGGISETDISLAATTNSVVIGFSVRPDNNAAELARVEGIDVKVYNVIYDLVNDVRDALQGLLKPIIREQVIGHCEIREVYTSSKEGQVLGGYVTDGQLQRNSMVRIYRDDVLVHTGTLASLRRFKDDVAEVQQKFECGLRIANFNEIRVGDLVEAFVNVEEAAILDSPKQA